MIVIGTVNAFLLGLINLFLLQLFPVVSKRDTKMGLGMWTIYLIYRLFFYLGKTSRIIEVLKNLLLGDFSGFIMVSV